MEDIIDFFIDHDNDLFSNFKEDVTFIDVRNEEEITYTKEEICDCFRELKQSLKDNGYKCRSGSFINGNKLKPKCRHGVSVIVEKDGEETEMIFGVDTNKKGIVNKVIRYIDADVDKTDDFITTIPQTYEE